jgi:hypothetical protein
MKSYLDLLCDNQVARLATSVGLEQHLAYTAAFRLGLRAAKKKRFRCGSLASQSRSLPLNLNYLWMGFASPCVTICNLLFERWLADRFFCGGSSQVKARRL